MHCSCLWSDENDLKQSRLTHTIHTRTVAFFDFPKPTHIGLPAHVSGRFLDLICHICPLWLSPSYGCWCWWLFFLRRAAPQRCVQHANPGFTNGFFLNTHTSPNCKSFSHVGPCSEFHINGCFFKSAKEGIFKFQSQNETRAVTYRLTLTWFVEFFHQDPNKQLFTRRSSWTFSECFRVNLKDLTR